METSILQQIKKRAGKFIEPQLLKAGRVLEVRAWTPATMIEIDLHLPSADIENWNEVPYIKVRVDDLCFRDYTPSGWDAETQTCSLIIDAAHDGPGSKWARTLTTGDTIQYLKIDTSRHAPDPTNLVVALGDESSLSHLLALQQMVRPITRFTGAVSFKEAAHRRFFEEEFRSPLIALAPNGTIGHESLLRWVSTQGFCIAHTIFYLAGNDNLVSKLRSTLKDQGFLSNQIKVKGFWS